MAVYDETPNIRRDEAVQRYNDLLQRLGLDDVRPATIGDAYFEQLPERW